MQQVPLHGTLANTLQAFKSPLQNWLWGCIMAIIQTGSHHVV